MIVPATTRMLEAESAESATASAAVSAAASAATVVPAPATTATPRIRVIVACILACLFLSFSLLGCSSGGESSAADQSTSADEDSDVLTPIDTSQETVAIVQGNTAPDFEFTKLDGSTAKLSDYRGNVVLLTFWATWCPYCIGEFPELDQLLDNYSNVTVIAIDRGDSAEDAMEAAQGYGYDFVWGIDESGASSSLYASNGIPYSIIIDADGVISSSVNGAPRDPIEYFSSALEDAGATKVS